MPNLPKRHWLMLLVFCGPLVLLPDRLFADEFDRIWLPFLQSNCLHCHDGSDEATADFSKLRGDFDQLNSQSWERIFDRVDSGEMPPATEPRPEKEEETRFLSSLNQALANSSKSQQRQHGRVVLRRLSPLEYEYTVNDLLNTQAELKGIIPGNGASPQFDTVASVQGFGPLHARKFIEAAEVALKHAIRLEPVPRQKKRRIEMKEHRHVRKHIETDDHVIFGETANGIILYSNASYLLKLPDVRIIKGRYRVRAKASSYQAGDRPVVLTLNAGDYGRGFEDTFGHFDVDSKPKVYEATTYLNDGQYLFPGVSDLFAPEDNSNIWNVGSKKYKGSGVHIEWIEVEGPLTPTWPPISTRELFQDVELEELSKPRWDHEQQKHYQFVIKPKQNDRRTLERSIRHFAKRAFRHPFDDDQLKPFLDLGFAALEQKRSLSDAVSVSVKALLSSPDFLFLLERPGRLSDHALAARLSYFLWKTAPDAALRRLADQGKLSEPQVLSDQIERMLSDKKLQRFVDDFCNQWLRLNEIDATSPDERLYPEYDDLLKKAMLGETRRFIRHLIDDDLSTDCLIDADFTFVNRRLAEHYGIEGVSGAELTKVRIPDGSLRGGLMTQASILKVTANGTVTSPVRRGSWVLTNLLGTPPNPPPPNVGSIEPDTRGAKTIRDLLEKHRDQPSCATCHQSIDPPGFAMESFDVIGGLRTRYRSKEAGERPKYRLRGRNIWEYRLAQPVDPSGTVNGKTFEDVGSFKQLMMKRRKQVARNVLEKLLVYSTGAEIQFADRAVVDQLLDRCEMADFGMRTMIREVVSSPIFKNK